MALVASSFALAQTVTVWTHFQDESLRWLQQEVAGFEAAFGVDVELVQVQVDEIVQNMLLAAPEGEGPDLVLPLVQDQLGQLAIGGVLADMSQYATASELEDLSEQSRLAFTVGGRLFGLPMYVEGPALIVNTELVTDTPETFEEFISTAQDLTTDDTFGFLQNLGSLYFSYIWLNSMGGYVFGGDAGTLDPSDIGLANEGAVRGGELIKRFRYDYDLNPAGTDYNVMHGQFIDGSAAMVYNGPWAIPEYRDAGIDFQVMPVPPMEDGTEFGGFMGVQGVVMNEFSTNKVNAANLAKWMTRPDAQVSLAELAGRIPASQGAAERVADDPVISGFVAALENAAPMPNIPEMGAVWGPMDAALTLILEDPDSDVSAILENAVAEIRSE